MNVNLMTKQHFEFLSLTGGCAGSSESLRVKMPHFWKSCVVAHFHSQKELTVLIKQKTDQEADSQDMDLSLPGTRIK